MKLVVGLGNPGAQYTQTRHNVGFRVVDAMAQQMGWSWNEHRNRAVLASGTIGPEKVALVKPLTYMNLSGESVAPLVRWYKLQPEDVLVVCDDLDLPAGRLRLRGSGSAGGHHGLENIIQHLHSQKFPRLRVGIGRPSNARMDTMDYLLGIPPLDERIQLATAEERAVNAIQLVIRQGIATTMNQVNVDPEAEEKRRQQRERERQEAEGAGQSENVHSSEGSDDRE